MSEKTQESQEIEKTEKAINPSEKSFEELLQQLQKVAHQLSSGDLPLDQSLRLYEKGVDLTRRCQDKLVKAESQIKKLSKNEGSIGKVNEEPFQR